MKFFIFSYYYVRHEYSVYMAVNYKKPGIRIASIIFPT